LELTMGGCGGAADEADAAGEAGNRSSLASSSEFSQALSRSRHGDFDEAPQLHGDAQISWTAAAGGTVLLLRRLGLAPSVTAASPDPALEAALEALFAAPFPEFVEERKRLVAGLRTGGHKAAAAALAKVNRPTLASWAINQLVRRAPSEVSAMFASAARVRLGDFAATGEHRQTIARLSALATDLLREQAQPTSEATLRRITTSLQALSAYGDFAPDLPGRMIADRDPPGFDAMVLSEGSAGATLPLSLGAQTLRVVPAPTPTPAPQAAPAEAAAPPRAPAPLLRLVPALAPDEARATDAAAAAAAQAAADAEAEADAALAAAEAERAVAEADAALVAAQAAAQAAAARVHLARQRAVLEDLRTRQRRAASSIFDHEQAIALMQRELEQRQTQLDTARRDAEALQADLERLTAELAALEPTR
jgi:hypothetical protein